MATASLVALLLMAAPVEANPRLLWAVEPHAATDVSVDERDADRPFNPASVIKLATTYWALERLGPDHAFETTFHWTGTIDAETGHLDGDLNVLGGFDPDFHIENAQLVARQLNAVGIRSVGGALRVTPGFWIGWEGGSERRLPDVRERALLMGERLSKAWDDRRWTRSELADLEALKQQRGWTDGFGSVRVQRVEFEAQRSAPSDSAGSVAHRSKPLIDVLRRFNVYSNNDIERLGDVLGEPAELASFLSTSLAGERAADEPPIEIGTLSGLDRNRMTPRQVLRLLDRLRAVLARHGLEPADVMAASGCGPSTLNGVPGLRDGVPSGAVVAKTGTLVQTDGGVVALAGWYDAGGGEQAFVVARSENGALLRGGRARLGRWVLERVVADGMASGEAGAAGRVASAGLDDVCPGELPAAADGADPEPLRRPARSLIRRNRPKFGCPRVGRPASGARQENANSPPSRASRFLPFPPGTGVGLDVPCSRLRSAFSDHPIQTGLLSALVSRRTGGDW